jgi:hypothetical protein
MLVSLPAASTSIIQRTFGISKKSWDIVMELEDEEAVPVGVKMFRLNWELAPKGRQREL